MGGDCDPDDAEIQTLQDEELEVLKSIYDNDTAFSQLTAKSFQHKFGENGEQKSFLLDISWGPKYPHELPTISLDAFYNTHLLPEVKSNILAKVKEEADNYLGMSMTYTLFEFVKEHVEELVQDQPDQVQPIIGELDKSLQNLEVANTSNQEAKTKDCQGKAQLTKAQKRRMWDKGGLDTEERPRGWDWVDVIKHLSQTGAKKDS